MNGTARLTGIGAAAGIVVVVWGVLSETVPAMVIGALGEGLARLSNVALAVVGAAFIFGMLQIIPPEKKLPPRRQAMLVGGVLVLGSIARIVPFVLVPLVLAGVLALVIANSFQGIAPGGKQIGKIAGPYGALLGTTLFFPVLLRLASFQISTSTATFCLAEAIGILAVSVFVMQVVLPSKEGRR